MIYTDIIQYIFIIYLGFSSLYIFIFAFAGLFKIRPKMPSFDAMRRYAVLIPGYKEDQVIIEVAKDALKQGYPKELYEVVIIADSFKKETLEALAKIEVRVIEVSFELSTKSKALNVAMDQLGDNYDVALILDADNLMQADFISKVNHAFNMGYTAIQGHRVAKNTNTSFAILDAISEEVNNRIFRKGHRVLGLSAALIGSGMAIDYKYFKNMMKSIKAIGGFDKELELQILKETRIIGYLEDAYVYDEKVQKADVFSNQRRRWLSAQIHYFSKDFLNSVKHLLKYRNIDYFDKAIQFIQPPRIMLLGLLFIINVLSILFNSTEWITAWLYVMGASVLTFIFSIPGKFYNFKTLFAILTLPKAFVLMFLSLLKVKGANKKFIHTEHTSN
jgi:cellulose synthase/poly-beta-1,6-N-acetylglucosamine synthase-like glycosyltransferase